jgi:uncharacterized membrane protein YhiD involved in acid resistance
MTAAIGVAAGLGRIGMATLGMLLTWFTLAVVGKIEHRIITARAARGDDAET